MLLVLLLWSILLISLRHVSNSSLTRIYLFQNQRLDGPRYPRFGLHLPCRFRKHALGVELRLEHAQVAQHLAGIAVHFYLGVQELIGPVPEKKSERKG